MSQFRKVLLDKLNAFQEYIQLTRQDKTISSLRESNLLLKPVTQMALAHVARMASNKGVEWDTVVERLNEIDWSFENQMWFNILVIGSANKKMITGKESVRAAGMVISYLVLGNTMDKSECDDVLTIIRNAHNSPDEELPSIIE